MLILTLAELNKYNQSKKYYLNKSVVKLSTRKPVTNRKLIK